MIYLEFIERDRDVPIEVFRHTGDQSQSWVEPDADRMILQLGRTLRFGPMPSYLAFWKIAGLERLDAWEDYFGSPVWHDNTRSQAMHRTIHIQRAGLYDELVERESFADGVHVVEYFDAGDDVTDAALSEALMQRAARHEAGRLELVLRRIGVWGPDPAHLAVWTFPAYAALNGLLREPVIGPGLRVTAGGIYRRLGEEIL
jgi:hypothetical protein